MRTAYRLSHEHCLSRNIKTLRICSILQSSSEEPRSGRPEEGPWRTLEITLSQNKHWKLHCGTASRELSEGIPKEVCRRATVAARLPGCNLTLGEQPMSKTNSKLLTRYKSRVNHWILRPLYQLIWQFHLSHLLPWASAPHHNHYSNLVICSNMRLQSRDIIRC